MQVATSFLQGQEAASNQERKKVPQAWRHQEGGHRQNFKKGGGFRSQHKTEKRPDRFTLLTKTPKEILALEKGKFKTPPPMTTPIEKRNANKFCEFHGEVGHNTDECNHLRKQIEDMLKAGKLSHIIRELKQSSGKEQPKKKGETSGKEKPQAILMIQSRQKVIRQKITQSFSPNLEMLFLHLRDDEGAEGPLIIKAEIGGHQVHRIWFSGEIKWPLGQITLLVKIGDDEHSTSAWMDFMVVRSTSPTQRNHVKALIDINKVKEERVKVTINPDPEHKKKYQQTGIAREEPQDQTVMNPVVRPTKKTEVSLCNLLSNGAWTYSHWTPTGYDEPKPQKGTYAINDDVSKASDTHNAAGSRRGKGVFHYHDWLCNPVIWPRVSVKGQVLANFIVERLEKEGQDDSAKEEEPLPFEATNNEAEYEALIAGLRIAEKIIVQNLQVNVDSKLVANQVNGTYIVKETYMIKYLEKVKALASTFRAFSIKQVPRSKNKKADALSKMASTSIAHLSKQVLVEELKEKSVNESEVLAMVEEEGDSWMTPIHEYLTDETLPAERKKARAIKRKSQRFAIINGILYKKSFLGPWLRCVGPSQANYVLREIHEGSCSMHAGTRSVVAKALRIGYYWPTMHKDARALIRACQECQVHKPVPRNPQEKLNPITSPWPFYKWGIDIAGPFPEGPGKVKFLIVAVDYFTKWIEAKPVATITGNQVKKFVWENIVCRFGLPGEIISDNGKQFRDNPFKDWCEKLCIQQHFASVKHPQTNGLVERANRSLGEGIKARLGKDNKNWIEEISHVLWAHRTMIKTSNGDTPFSLTYGTKAINLELLEEKREQATIAEAKSKRQMEKYYNAKVRNIRFKLGDFVYRSNEASRAEDIGKLGPIRSHRSTWERIVQAKRQQRKRASAGMERL
ncbi:reverse transcriptase domain-containing protein [Tanacetum coccineum]